jgi:hypothetical protein
MPGREKVLLDRCMPSIMALDWPEVEHIIVSDPNPELRTIIRKYDNVRWVEINDTWRDGVKDLSIGAVPWHIGSLMALGEYVGFVGDDDELLPDHVTRHAEALQEFDFSVTPIQFRAHGDDIQVIGDRLACGFLDATGIMCRREALRVANWHANGEDAADWRLVRDWMDRGLKGTVLQGPPTGIHNDGWMIGQSGKAHIS